MTSIIARPPASPAGQANEYLRRSRALDNTIPVDRRAPRTVAEMTARLTAVAQQMPDDEDDACPLCGHWTCRCGRSGAVQPRPPADQVGEASAEVLWGVALMQPPQFVPAGAWPGSGPAAE